MGAPVRVVDLLVAAAVAFAAIGCGDDELRVDDAGADVTTTVAADDRSPDIEGTVTAIDPFEPVTTDCVDPGELDPDGSVSDQDPPVCTPEDSTRAGTFLVEEVPGEQTGRKISFSVDATTTITGADGISRSGPDGFGSLGTGAEVAAWTSGPCAESYPEQCAADLVVVRAEAEDPT